MTPLIRHILFATDFSDCANRAQAYAVFMAAAYGAALDILHVLELHPGLDPVYPINALYLDQLRKEADHQIEAFLNWIQQEGISATGRQVIGIPSQRIIEAAQASSADLVVLGTHGRTGLEHILLGSTAERVVRGAPCPVLTVRGLRASKPEGRASGPPAMRRLLVPIDFSDCSLEALEYAAQLAKQFDASVMILHVMEPVAYGLDFTLSHASEGERRRAAMQSRLSALADAFRAQGLIAEHALRGGVPAQSILAMAQEQAWDLIVMGTHGRHGVARLLAGSVAEAVLRSAPCPVLTVKSPKFGPAHRRLIAQVPAVQVVQQ